MKNTCVGRHYESRVFEFENKIKVEGAENLPVELSQCAMEGEWFLRLYMLHAKIQCVFLPLCHLKKIV